MAKIGLTATVYSNGACPTTGNVSDPTAGLPATATVAANIATLVADGATPTQAHVTTLNTNWGTFLTAFNAYAAAYLGANATLLIDATAITTMNQLKAALAALLRQAAASTTLTP
jgi:hypothetical protein